MTVKSKGSIEGVYDYWYWQEGYNGGEVEHNPLLGYSSHSSISYEKPGFKRFGDCYHRRMLVKETDNRVTGLPGEQSGCALAMNILYTTGIPDVDVDDGFNARAFQAMKPRIDPVILGPVEIKELVFGWKELLKPFRRGSSLISKAGSTNLWYQFGIAPTIGSIRDTIDALKKFEQRLDDFLRLQGTPLTSHYSEKVNCPGYTFAEADKMTSTYPWQARTVMSDYETVTTATMQYTYTVPAAQRYKKDVIKLMAQADLFGLSSPIAMVWEMIPFSFVIDWFINVGDFLGQFDKPYLDTVVVVLDYCISIKATRELSVDQWRGLSEWVQGYNVIINTYSRTRCIPDHSAFGIRQADHFGTKQFLLGLSLLVS